MITNVLLPFFYGSQCILTLLQRQGPVSIAFSHTADTLVQHLSTFHGLEMAVSLCPTTPLPHHVFKLSVLHQYQNMLLDDEGTCSRPEVKPQPLNCQSHVLPKSLPLY